MDLLSDALELVPSAPVSRWLFLAIALRQMETGVEDNADLPDNLNASLLHIYSIYGLGIEADHH
jgi:hypothetical protein